MKHLQLYETWTYDKIMDKFKSDKELDEIVSKYIYWKSGNSKTKMVNIKTSRILPDYVKGILCVNYSYTVIGGGMSGDDVSFSHTFRIEDAEEFDRFAKDPDVYIEQEKYNL